MADHNPLNLADLDPAIWYVGADNTEYGPFTRGQIKSYFEEGRITLGTPIRKGRDGKFSPASSFSALSELSSETNIEEPLILGSQTTYAIIISCEETSIDEIRLTIGPTLNRLGQFVETVNNVYLLRSVQTVAEVRRELSHTALPGFQAIILESPNGLGWLGLESDLDAHIRSFWEMARAS